MTGLGLHIALAVLFGLLFGAGPPNALASEPTSCTSYLSGYDEDNAFGRRWPQIRPQSSEICVGLQVQAADTARRSSPLDVSRVPVPVATVGVTPTLPLREISYYPKDYPWREFWRHWPQAKVQMDEDLDRIKALGANTVRIFVHPDIFGYPIPTDIYRSRFDEALALIDAHRLKAHVTLFDCWQSWGDVSGSQTWVRHLVQPRRNDARIAVWELRNEVGLNQPAIRAWVQALFPYLKAQAGSTFCTVSVSNVEWLADVVTLTGSTPPDIYSLHWYPDVVSWTRPFPMVIDRARELIGAAPLLIGEFGLSTYAYSDISQADLYADVLYYAHQKGIDNLGGWTLNDFSPGAISCNGPITKTEELYFGLYRTDGSPKPAQPILLAAFHGNPPSQLSPVRMYNTSFEDLNHYSGYLDNWWSWDERWTGTHWETQDCTIAHSGHCSVRLSPSVTAGPSVTMTVGLYNVPALPVVGGRSFNVEGYVQTRNLHGEAKLVLSWFGDTGWLGITESQPITAANLTQWTRISMHDVQPLGGAEHVEVFVEMKSTDPTSAVWFDDVIVLTERVRLPLILKAAQ